MSKSPSDKAAQNDLFRRKLEYEQRARQAGGKAGMFGWGLMLIGLAIVLFGRYLPGADRIPAWLGMLFLIPASACFLLVIVNRARWRRNHPFKG